MPLPEKFAVIIPPQDISCYPGCMKQLAKGDPAAFNWIYKNFSKKIYDYALLLSGNVELSEDIVQEIFLRLWKNREKLFAVDNLNAYLHTMTRNEVNDYWRRQKLERNYIQTGLHPQNAEPGINDHKEIYKILNDALDQLPAKQKLVYKLKKEEQMKGEKIAEALNISVFTVKNHYQKALKSVKTYVTQRLNN